VIQQYKEAIEKSNIVSKTDINGIITFVNDEFCKISGYTREELIGKNHNIVRDPSVSASNFKLLWDTIKNKQTYKSTVKNRKKDGTAFYVNTTVIPILDKNGEIEEFIAIRYDVTKEVFLKKELEEKELQLKQLNKNLEKKVQVQTSQLLELNQTLELRVQEEIAKNEEKQKIMFWQSRLASLGQMLANVAHQWRQPLTQLNLNIYNMKKASLKGEKDEVLDFYNESKNVIQNMSTTIDDFTNFFKPEKEKKYFNLEQSINESIGILEKMIAKEQIIIELNCPKIILLGIPNELSQVIINIIQNSRDAFRDNSITEKKIFINTKKTEQFVVIEIQDNAGGVESEILDKVFEPYFTTKHSSSGTGLGLFMSKMICEQGFNGTINLINNKDGILLTIKIPLEG
jgi:PAS domain S-box-containing protein